MDGRRARPRGKPRRPPTGTPPGMLIADPAARPTELTLTLIGSDSSETVHRAGMKDVVDNLDRWPLIWLDCTGLADVGLIGEIGSTFGLHPLALEDVVTDQRPKVDFYDDNAFFSLSMIDDPATLRYEQIGVFFGEKFVVTFQERPGDPFDPVRKRIGSAGQSRLRTRGGDALAYALIDAVVDSFFTPIEVTAEAIERIEDDILRSPRKEQMEQLQAMRRSINVLRSILWPLRDALSALMRNDASYIHAETKIYFNDTLDHAIRLIQMVETERDTMTGLIEMHLSLSQARTNDIISLLTIVSAIFIPLTFLVGVWGMNFDPDASPWNMPELRSYYGYPLALLFMLAVAVGMYLYFRWKKWL